MNYRILSGKKQIISVKSLILLENTFGAKGLVREILQFHYPKGVLFIQKLLIIDQTRVI